MNCMKCGREIAAEQVFCEACLEDMEKYPVKPGVVVHIPSRPQDQPQKKAARKKAALTPEEQVHRLKRKVIALRIVLLCMLVSVGLLAYAAVHMADELDMYRFWGQNYSTVETADKDG